MPQNQTPAPHWIEPPWVRMPSAPGFSPICRLILNYASMEALLPRFLKKKEIAYRPAKPTAA